MESADGPVLVLEAPETASREAKNRKKPETPCPASDALPDAVAEWARRWAIPTEHAEFSNFLLHAQTNDRRCRDWKAAWARWTINAPRFAPRAGANGARHVQSAENRSWKLPPEAP